jgi:hypothetical protein
VYLHLIYCKDKEWIHGETRHKTRSRYACAWMDDGMIAPFYDVSLLLFYFEYGNPSSLSSLFLVMLLGMPFFFFFFWDNHNFIIFFRNTWREVTQYMDHLIGGWMECANSRCRNFAMDAVCA